MKKFFLSFSILILAAYCANAIATQGFIRYNIDDMYTDPARVFAHAGEEFKITKRCLSDQKWRSQALPENVTFCGLEITEGIWYENNLVLGGPGTHDYHYTFKMNQKGPVMITFELLNAQNQIEKSITTKIVTFMEYSDHLNEWLLRERELMIPFSEIDNMPIISPCDGMQKTEITNASVSKIDKQALISEIKGMLYMIFVHEMGIIGGDFSDMAQGNPELAQDLNQLFCVSFNSGDEVAQKRLDEFCDKWELEKIEICKAHTFL